MKINLGKVKIGVKNMPFSWGKESNNFLLSTTTAVICKDEEKRRKYIETILKDNSFEILTLNSLSKGDLMETTLSTLRDTILARLNGEQTSDESILLYWDDYDLSLHTRKDLLKYVNYINDYGKRVNVFLLLGINNVNDAMSQFINSSVDNVVLLSPYSLHLLVDVFQFSTNNLMNEKDAIKWFCDINNIDFNLTSGEPDILKNGNIIYVLKIVEEK